MVGRKSLLSVLAISIAVQTKLAELFGPLRDFTQVIICSNFTTAKVWALFSVASFVFVSFRKFKSDCFLFIRAANV